MDYSNINTNFHLSYTTSAALIPPTLLILPNQGIIDYTGMETFAKEPKLAKLLRELKSMPVRWYKKCLLVFLVCLKA